MDSGFEQLCADNKPDKASWERWLHLMSNTPEIQEALGELLREYGKRGDHMIGADLVTEEGQRQTLRIQGELQGIRRAFDILTKEKFDG